MCNFRFLQSNQLSALRAESNVPIRDNCFKIVIFAIISVHLKLKKKQKPMSYLDIFDSSFTACCHNLENICKNSKHFVKYLEIFSR